MKDSCKRLVEELMDRGDTVSVAESCTGGLLGAVFTSIPNASKVFWGGVISYDDDAKRNLIGVPESLLHIHGAVSSEVAVAMARGIREVAATTWAVALTGIAGPSGGTPQKPVGTVWIAIDGPVTDIQINRFDGNRDVVREASVNQAIALLSSCLCVNNEVDEPDE